MNLKEIKDLINLMNEHSLSEVEIEHEGSKIRLKKGDGGVSVEKIGPAAARRAEGEAPVVEKPPSKPFQVIKSPMVGTFYSAPAPDAEPYIKIGQKIEVGQVVCIIEAMKLMNEIKTEVKGVVTEIHVSNGEAVEFGQPLFTLS